MGTRLTVPSVTFSDYIDIVKYPVPDQLSSLFYLGGSSSASIVNQAAGGANASAAGANVTFSTNYAEFTGDPTAAANLIQTPDLDNASQAIALISVSQCMDTTDRFSFGAFDSTADGAALLSTVAWAIAAGPTIKSVAFGGAAAPHSAMQFKALSYDPGTGVMSAFQGAASSLVKTQVTVGSSRLVNALGARIGGSYVINSYTGDLRIAAVAKHERALTDAEMALIYKYFQLRYAKLSVTVA